MSRSAEAVVFGADAGAGQRMSAEQLEYVDIDRAAAKALRATHTLAESGAYYSALTAYLRFGELPKDPAKLAAFIDCTPIELAETWPVVSRQCVETPTGWRVLLPRAAR